MQPATWFEFLAPPLPHYIASGEDTYAPGQGHISRRNIGVFDLLLVTEGCLWIGEEQAEWEVQAGQTLLLRPDRSHYTPRACSSRTHFYWLAFQSSGIWSEIDPAAPDTARPQMQFERAQQLLAGVQPSGELGIQFTEIFPVRLPRLGTLTVPGKAYDHLDKLIKLDLLPQSAARYEQHIVFQQLLKEIEKHPDPADSHASRLIAEQAASFIRSHYREKLTYEWLQKELHFHPTYIARCMQKVFGCTLLDYLHQYRIEKAKLLLLHTDNSIAIIADELGYANAGYFTRMFGKAEGMPPLAFRKRLRP